MGFWLNLVTPFIVIALIAVLFALWLRDRELQCGSCCARFRLPVAQLLLAPKWMFKKYVTCPVCGKQTWAALVPKE